ncbi:MULTISPECIES: hypothetical protein [unclassified Streptomyces]|uniref:Uncharacterized protein n=1 Tax=Streptomyces sp. NBC_00119 TaxID=2975659 RepID=A0AAU1TX50_9ACTN|nr:MULTISPECIES: hypothetical protein [unclassified Streptomyces]MCX4648013.1 hypothetical protein [Streptomyces sp. NBC_01446]MCX5323828.1 hypothetical protein [Streptomyces sp. NBC_00120]
MKIPTPITAFASGFSTTAASMPWPIVILCVLASVVPSVLGYLANQYQTRRQFDFADKLLEATNTIPARDRVELTRHLAQVATQGLHATSLADSDGPAPTAPTVPGTPP